ncbi:MAG: glycosyltransferase family 2 protein [Candidatus Bathyarchaeia archaeon]
MQLNDTQRDRTVLGVTQPKPATKENVTIVLPVLNEEAGIGMVLDELTAHGYSHILVVDGYSTDQTVQVAESKGAEVVSQHGRGKTGAIKTAIDNVSTPYMLIMDGDFTYDAGSVERFLDHAENYEQIIGARSRANISPLHRIGNHVITRLFNLMFDTTTSDVCSGMYLLRTDSARDLELHTGGFAAEVEIIAQMSMRGEVTEVPINYRARMGRQKLSTWKHGSQIMYTILNLARVYNPVFLFALIAALVILPGIGVLAWVLGMWLMRGIFYSGWALLGMVLIIGAGQAFIVGTLSLVIKRSEVRIMKMLKQRSFN